MSSYATLVSAFPVLELKTDFLTLALDDKLVFVLLHQIFETGILAFRNTTTFRIAFCSLALGSFPP